MKINLILILLLGQTLLFAQTNNIPDDLYAKANTAKDANYLSQDEKDVILYMNLARLNGNWFINNIILANNDFTKQFSKKYKNSLIADLKQTKGLKPLYPSNKLTKAARYHAKDMGKSGKTGHRSSNGTPTFKRIKKYAQGGYMGENCQYGWSDPIQIVLDLLIDDGIPSVGHRKNILSPNFKYVGVAIEPHKKYRVNCVQDFSDTGD